jgi:hypothetical protein
MRNLVLSATSSVSLPSPATTTRSVHISATSFDVDEHVLYVASEKPNDAGEVEIEIWKVEGEGMSGDVSIYPFSSLFSFLVFRT